ncbi:MAG: Hpt domain-containing protein [Bacteriovorax sp.]|nr:Hpt domain-containing protein [Bacteriovorax sp.]
MHILKEHKIKYLSRRIDEIIEIKQSLVLKDFNSAVFIGHKLKGNGVTFGFPIISQIGIELEEAGKTKNLPRVADAINRLVEIIEKGLKDLI